MGFYPRASSLLSTWYEGHRERDKLPLAHRDPPFGEATLTELRGETVILIFAVFWFGVLSYSAGGHPWFVLLTL
jgi:hypothetical protein